MSKRIKFYTYPPIEHDFVLRNLKQKPLDFAKHEIVDCGVMELLKYPYFYSDQILDKFVETKTGGWKTVPDYPDIFKEHGIKNMDIDNVILSKTLLQKYYNPNDESHLPVIQGYYNDPYSFVEYSKWFKDLYGEPEKIGVGTVCKASTKTVILRTLSLTRREFPNSHIHAFGLSIRHLQLVKNKIDSFDSTAWTFPRMSGLPSAKNKAMRIDYFKQYLEDVKHKLDIAINEPAYHNITKIWQTKEDT